MAGSALAGAYRRDSSLCAPVGRKFFLEPDLFSLAGIWRFLFVAGAFMGAHLGDDTVLCKGGSESRAFADPLSAVGHLCRVPELCSLDTESLNRRLCALGQRGNNSVSGVLLPDG